MRRHLIGLGLAVIMILVMFFAGAWGYVRLLRLPAAASAPVSGLPAQGGSLLGNTSVLVALGALLVTGVLAGVLVATPWISPLAAGLPGLLALAWEVLYLGSVHQAVRLIPLRGDAFGAGWEALLFNGVLGAVGIAMVVPVAVPSRWQSRGTGRGDDDRADISDAQDYVAGLKESMANANPPRSPAPPSGRATGAMPRATGAMPRATGAMPRVAASPARATGGMPRVPSTPERPSERLSGRPSRTGLVGGRPGTGGGRPRPER
jgi:hypothetical protein